MVDNMDSLRDLNKSEAYLQKFHRSMREVTIPETELVNHLIPLLTEEKFGCLVQAQTGSRGNSWLSHN